MNALGYILGLFALSEFKKRKLDIVYQKEIEDWLLHKKQESFGEKLGKQILAEIDRYMAGKKSIDELIKESFPQIIHLIEYP
jgi:hypothetical protein